jgi:hypothetical protein
VPQGGSNVEAFSEDLLLRRRIGACGYGPRFGQDRPGMKLLDVDDLRTAYATRAGAVHAVAGVSLHVVVTRGDGSRVRLRSLRPWRTR